MRRRDNPHEQLARINEILKGCHVDAPVISKLFRYIDEQTKKALEDGMNRPTNRSNDNGN